MFEKLTLMGVRDLLPLDSGWGLLDHLVEDTIKHREELDAHFAFNTNAPYIESPVIIVGPPRTGTTFLHRRLSEYLTNHRVLKGWEATIPTEPSGDPNNDPRGDEHTRLVQALYDTVPVLKELHDEPAYEAAECVRAMAMTGLTGLWPAIAPCPDYIDWLTSDDAQICALGAYEFYGRCLNHLENDKPWLLKGPTHSLFMPWINDVWSEVTFIRIHRNLDQATHSLIRYFSHLRTLSKPGIVEHEREVAKWARTYLEFHKTCVDDYEEEHPDNVISIHSTELRMNPAQTVQRIAMEIMDRR